MQGIVMKHLNCSMNRALLNNCILIVFLLCVSFVSCSPNFWHGVAQSLDSNSSLHPGYNNPTSDQETVCVKYKTNTGWSKGYRVNAYILKGSELNRKTRTYDYNSYSTYVVVFWDKGEASILELDVYFGSISSIGNSAKDQYGRKWQVSKSSFCY